MAKAKQLEATLSRLRHDESLLTGRPRVGNRRFVPVLVISEGLPLGPVTRAVIDERLRVEDVLQEPVVRPLHIMGVDELEQLVRRRGRRYARGGLCRSRHGSGRPLEQVGCAGADRAWRRPAHDPEEQTGLTAARVADIATGEVPMITLPPTVGGATGLRARSATPDAPGQAPAAAKAKIAEVAPSATAAGTAIAPVKVYGLSASTELTGQLTTISDATGGSTEAIDASDDFTGKIVRTAEDAATAPVARLTLADTVLAGAPTVLSGLSSSYTGATPTYGFGFDNDGKVDETNQDGAVRHTYSTAGPVDARSSSPTRRTHRRSHPAHRRPGCEHSADPDHRRPGPDSDHCYDYFGNGSDRRLIRAADHDLVQQRRQ
ncbi:hypothetical protein ACWEOG_24730 [Amycolatopsis japonica]